MLCTKVKISHVNNLTDARYFAAAGVDYLGFCCNPGTEKYCTPSKINEIRQWVTGPEFVLEIDGWQAEADIKTLIDNNLGHALHLGAFATYKENFGIPIFKDYILENIKDADFEGVSYPVLRSDRKFTQISESEISYICNLLSDLDVFLDIPFDPLDIRYVIDAFHGCGLILRGGEEEKTGFKSFAELDIIFEILEV